MLEMATAGNAGDSSGCGATLGDHASVDDPVVRSARLLNDLIRPQQQRWRDREAKNLRSLEVDD